MDSRILASLQRVDTEAGEIHVAGTLEGDVDIAFPDATYTLHLHSAKALQNALSAAIEDVEKNCLYDKDSLLTGDGL